MICLSSDDQEHLETPAVQESDPITFFVAISQIFIKPSLPHDAKYFPLELILTQLNWLFGSSNIMTWSGKSISQKRILPSRPHVITSNSLSNLWEIPENPGQDLSAMEW